MKLQRFNTLQRSNSSRSSGLARQLSPLALAISAGLLGASAWANNPLPNSALPVAGTIISNMAVGEYIEEGTTVVQTSRSNLVETTIVPVYAFRLEANRSIEAARGAVVYFSHELRNTGNIADSYTLSLTDPVGGLEFADEAVYFDRNRDGVPDGVALTPTQLAALPLQAGEAIGLVIAATVPVAGVLGTTYANSLILSADSNNDSGLQTLINQDSITVTDNGVMTVRKSFSVTQTASGNVITVHLDFVNNGNAPINSFTLTDILDDPRLVYQAGSAVLGLPTGGSTIALTDAAGGDSAPYNYQYDSLTDTVSLAFSGSFNPATERRLSFNVLVSTPVAGSIPNTASLVYDPDNNPVTPNDVTVPTNTATVLVPSIYAVEINGISGSASAAPADNLVIEPSVAQGGVASFNNYVWNTGNIADTYNLTIGSSNLPAGSVVEFFRADGVTPVLDSNGDGVPDTGSLAVGQSLPIVVKVRFPASTTTVPVGGYRIFPVAQSIASAATNNSVEDRTDAIDVQLVDLFNTNPNSGVGNGVIDNAGAALKTLSTQAGTTVIYPISVTHTGTPTQYSLAADADTDFAAPNLPAGVSVVFAETGINGNCTPIGATTGQTRLLNDGETQALCAVVSVAAGTPADTVDLYFRAFSPTYVSAIAPTNAGSDIIKNALTIVNPAQPLLSFTPDLRGQIAPGGTIVYTHTIANEGDTVITPRAGTPFIITNDQTGFTTTLYLDVNDNGLLDAVDTIISTTLADLQPNERIRIFAKVEASPAVLLGTENLTLIELYGVGDVLLEQVQDITTVSDNLIRLTKLQALDADCNGSADGSYTTASLSIQRNYNPDGSAGAGQCVLYRVIARNEGAEGINTFNFRDATPAGTVLFAAPTCTPVACTGVTAPTVGSAGAVSGQVSSIPAGASREFNFAVRYDGR